MKTYAVSLSILSYDTYLLPFYLTYSRTYLLIYLLIQSLTRLFSPWSRVLLEKLFGSQLVKKFPAFYGTRRFITSFTCARYLSLSWASSLQSMSPSYFLKIHLNIMLPSTPESSKWHISLRFPHQSPICISLLPHTCYMPRPPHSSRFDHPNNTGSRVQIIKLLAVSTPLLPRPSLAQIFSSTLYSETPSGYVPPSVWATRFHTHTQQQAKLYFCASYS